MLRIRFLQTTPSQRPEFPFQVGQVIVLERLTPEARQWIKDGRAEVLKGDPPEAAVTGLDERAVEPKSERRAHVRA